MVYKIGTVDDLSDAPIHDEHAKSILSRYATILTENYGKDRNAFTDDGGYILYAVPGTSPEEIRQHFDYTQHVIETVEKYQTVCAAVYIVSSDYGVVIVTSISDTPKEILEEINQEKE